jgi:hypothetical protein
MTAKEKAEELIKKFTFNTRCFSETKGWKDSLYDAKQCALIAVNQIIEALETYDEMTEKHLKREFPNYLSCELQNMEQDFRYYQKVKQEIENLC